MRYKLNVNRRSIFVKLVLVFLLILLPVFTVGWFNNEFASRSVASEIAQSMESKVEFYMKLLEVDLSKIIQFQRQYVNDSDLLELSGGWEFMSFPERTYASERLQRRLLLLQSSSLYIKDVAVMLPAMSRIVSAYSPFEDLDRDLFQGLLRTNGAQISHFTYWQDRLFITMPAPGWSYRDHEDPLYLLAVELDIPRIRDLLKQMNTNSEGYARLASEKNRWSISSSDKEIAAADEGLVSIDNHSSELNLTLSAYVPETIAYAKLKKYKQWYWLLSAFAVAAVLVFALWIHRNIHNPLNKLVRAFRHLEEGNLNITVKHEAHDEFRYVFAQFNGTVVKLGTLINDVYEQKYRAQLSELRQLQAQINPHFLYNALFNLQLMAKLRDNENIDRFTSYLGDYFLYITRNASAEVTLAEEVAHAQKYVHIQSFRFSGRIAAKFGELPEACRNIAVPRLILQPVLENAYKYGLEPKRSQGLLQVGFVPGEESLTILIEDNGESLSDEKLEQISFQLKHVTLDTETTGMINVSRRLQLRYGMEAGLAVSRSGLGGMKVAMKLPVSGREEQGG
ncbi:sensor histidine kinase [Paenibacillus sp. GCM10027626]|uniref:sensor histidine kinase n=1 Tax=Paenibacillus sp. GCM10027626 TaxID=3273411 RepID=UPI00362AFF83